MTQGEQAQKKLFLCSSFFDAQHSDSKVFLAREIVFYINWFPHTASRKNPRFRHLPRAWSIRVSRAVDVYLELRKVWSATSYNTWWNDVEKVALHENKAENGSQQMESSKLKNFASRFVTNFPFQCGLPDAFSFIVPITAEEKSEKILPLSVSTAFSLRLMAPLSIIILLMSHTDDTPNDDEGGSPIKFQLNGRSCFGKMCHGPLRKIFFGGLRILIN